MLDDLAKVGSGRAAELSGVVERVAHMLGGTKASKTASQFLLNALRKEPGWAQQAIIVQAGRSEPMLISQWPLPDNPGSALRRVIHSSYYRVFSDGKSGDWIGEMLSTFPQSKMNIY